LTIRQSIIMSMLQLLIYNSI